MHLRVCGLTRGVQRQLRAEIQKVGRCQTAQLMSKVKPEEEVSAAEQPPCCLEDGEDELEKQTTANTAAPSTAATSTPLFALILSHNPKKEVCNRGKPHRVPDFHNCIYSRM